MKTLFFIWVILIVYAVSIYFGYSELFPYFTISELNAIGLSAYISFFIGLILFFVWINKLLKLK